MAEAHVRWRLPFKITRKEYQIKTHSGPPCLDLMCSDMYQGVPKEAALLSISNQDEITKGKNTGKITQGRALAATDSHRPPLQQP